MPSRGWPEQNKADENDPAAQERNPRRSSSASQHSAQGGTLQQGVAAASGRKRPRRNKSAPPSTISIPSNAASKTERALLQKLSQACRKHHLFHKDSREEQNSSNNDDDDYEGGSIPKRCSQDLKALKVIVPKVEKAFSAKKGPEGEDVAQLCEFYRNVLAYDVQDSYCPYARQIFRKEGTESSGDGQADGKSVLSRVHYLYEHLITPRMIDNTKAGSKVDKDSPELHNRLKACNRPATTTWIIEKTIAQLLFFLGAELEHSAQIIQLDMVQLLMDLAVLAHCDDNMLASSNVQLQLLSKTCAKLGLVHQDGDDHHDQEGEGIEYILEVPNREAIWTLQSATLNVLIEWSQFWHTKSFEPIDTDENNDTQQQKLRDEQQLQKPMSQIQLYESKRDLLASIRPILSSNSVSTLAERARSAALEMLVHSGLLLPRIGTVGNDTTGGTENGVELDLMLEVGLLVVEAIGGVLLRQAQWAQYAPSQQTSTQSEDVLSNLTLLLRHCVFFPPRVGGYNSTQVQSYIGQTILQPLLEGCLPWMVHPHDGALPKEVQPLQVMVLRAIHACLYITENRAMIEASPVRVVGPLLEMMKDPELSQISVWILWAILKPHGVDVDAICASAWEQRHSTPRHFWAPKIPPQPTDYPPPKKNESSPTKPLSPTTHTAASTKSKRKTSILGSSPLTILSPAAKRRKEEPSPDAHRKKAASSPSRQSTLPTATSYFLEDVLQMYFVLSLQASHRISEYAMSCASGRIEDPSLPKDDIHLVSGSLKVLVCLVQNNFNRVSRPNQKGDVTMVGPENSTLLRLANSWQEICFSINAAAAKGKIKWSKDWHSVASVAVSCGLHSWCSTNSFQTSISPALKEVFVRGTTSCCDALGLVASIMDQYEPRPVLSGQHSCQGTCQDLSNALALHVWEGPSMLAGTSSCLCSLIHAQPIHMIDNDWFRKDCATMTLLTLPLPTRCCLLACFRQSLMPSFQRVSDGGDHAPCWASVLNSGSIFVKLLKAKPLVWNEMTSAALVLSSLMLVSSCLPSPVEQTQNGWESRLRLVLNDFMKDVLLPAVQTINAADTITRKWKDRASLSFLMAIRHFQWLDSALEGAGKSRNKELLTPPGRVVDDTSVAVSFLCRPSIITCDDVAWVAQNHKQIGVSTDKLRRDATFKLADAAMEHSDSQNQEGSSYGRTPPTIRLLRWKCVAWEFLRLNNPVSLKDFMWLVQTPFSDPDAAIREATSREIGRMLLSNNGCGLFALFAQEEAWSEFSGGTSVQDASFPTSDVEINSRLQRRAASERIVDALFDEIDSLIATHCDEPPPPTSLLPDTGDDADAANELSQEDRYRFRSRQYAATLALSSLCRHASAETTHGRSILEKSLLRLCRLLTVSEDLSSSLPPFASFWINESTPAASFGELMRLFRCCNLEKLLRENRLPLLLPGLIRDVLFPNPGIVSRYSGQEGIDDLGPALREQRYWRLYGIFQAILGGSSAARVTAMHIHEVANFVNLVLPYVLAEFVVKKDYDCLRLVAGFVLFLQSIKKHKERAAKKREGSDLEVHKGMEKLENALGDPTALSKSKAAGANNSTTELEYQLRILCLSPKIVEGMIPCIFMKSDRTELSFYTSVVLQKGYTLKQIVTAREQVILKMLVWNLGADPDLIGPAMRSIRAAAIARKQESGVVANQYPHEKDAEESKSNSIEAKAGDPHAVASRWVSDHFMYLVVNLVQYQWRTSSNSKRLHAMRCFNGVLSFLLPSDAPQYFPQVMATINAAIEDQSQGNEGNTKDHLDYLRLRLLAVQALSTFCHLACQNNWECLGQNLTNVVVSLIPVLAESDQTNELSRESSRLAVGFLEWLTKNQLGKKLAMYFKDIPFLPTTAKLDGVRAALKTNGVDFDNLLVMTQSTQQNVTSRESHSEAGSVCSSDTKGASGRLWSVQQQNALSKRIYIVCSLLGNENTSTRQVVLHHLVDLLRANRSLFHSLIETERGSSTGHFLTVLYSGSSKIAGSSSGSITKMMGILLARCVHETDPKTRRILGACLGEVGAIAEPRLGVISMSKVLGASDSLNSNDSSWRLKSAPWKSQQTRYELQLVTRHLVVALKAAPTSSEQHKIAFAIQQLLQLLDKSSQDTLAQTTSGKGNTERHAMSNWLKQQLEEAGVFETVEPFWNSEFSEVESFGAKEPPFFQGASSYYLWLSHWCRFMVKRSHAKGSPWSALFYACRTAIRTPVGLRVAEFILPLLVLDRLCFGEMQDRKIIVQELQDVFMCDKTKDAAAACLSHPERRKAVNTAFMVMDTLQFWAENETEENHKSSRSMMSSRASKPGTSTHGLWPSDESIFQIDEILSKIPLLVRAKAAASVGMYARALRLLEMAARQSVVDEVFNASNDEQTGKSPKGKRSTSRSLGNHIVTGVDLNLMKDVLAELNNCDTMASLEEGNRLSHPVERTMNSVRQNEAEGKWEAALRDYERIQQLRSHQGSDPKMQRGALRCLLELGQFESVINQVKGISGNVSLGDKKNQQATQAALAKPYAVEAAWRLGRWSALSDLIQKDGLQSESRQFLGPEGTYQIAQGEAMLALHERNEDSVSSTIRVARQAAMDNLSSVARESYSRAYPYLVRLQCLRELEDASSFLCWADESKPVAFSELAESISRDGWGWQRRLELVAPAGAAAVINTRLALARLAGDSALEGSLFLDVGRKARKNGLFNIAADTLAQAEAAFNSMSRDNVGKGVDSLLEQVKMQLAKLKHDSGQSSSALKMLGEDDVHHMIGLNADAARSLIISQEAEIVGTDASRPDDGTLVERFACRVLQSTKWMVEGGLKDGAEIISRFSLIHKIAPKMEKAQFQFAKYIDSIMQSRVATLMNRSQSQSQSFVDEDLHRADTIFNDKTCQEYTILAMKHYSESLKLSLKHVYQALPRLLSLWFEFTAIKGCIANGLGSSSEDGKTTSKSRRKSASYGSRNNSSVDAEKTATDNLIRRAMQANKMMADYRKIPPQAFYTAMPQLIAQVMHSDKETAEVVLGILARVLTKFPEQAMWQLLWLVFSEDGEKKRIGGEIFARAQNYLEPKLADALDALRKGEEPAKFPRTRKVALANLLVESKELAYFLLQLAITPLKSASNKKGMKVKPWRSSSMFEKVALCEFIPPVQAALSAAMISSDDRRSSDLFPREVPRMRDFSHYIEVMSSKARPKKITAFIIPCANVAMAKRLHTDPKVDKKPQPGDIGEVHFLVKQEQKGDLRKDARVQDLNNVINRLMSSSRKGDAPSQNRQMRLRTFAVTCLSEVTGMLEWVPNTNSMRSLIQRSYNPQASAVSNRRRGRRVVDFGDASMRVAYEQTCQDQYFKYGNLTKAAANFDEYLLKQYPPVFYWWFVQRFQDPHAWYEARNLFTLSAAVWSGVGHVIGLGDRHAENILLDTTNGECVHVDFDCLFDKGLNLPRPEVVPFRLTANMLDAFGPTGADGLYTSALRRCMETLRAEREVLLSVLEPFIKDPVIDWKRARSTQSPKKSGGGNELSQAPAASANSRQLYEAKRSVKVLDERLRGIYNLRNPNHKKIRRTDGLSVDQNVQLAQLLPLSVEGQVHKMIAEATSSENLVQLYVGWMSWV